MLSLTPQSSDPRDTYKQKLLNILLLAVGALSLLVIVAMALIPANEHGTSETGYYLPVGVCLFIGTSVLYYINNHRSGLAASSLFLLLLVIAFAFTDRPAELVNGRSSFIFTIPIIMGSVLLRSYASFIVAILATGVLSLLAMSANITPNLLTILVLFLIATISWVSSRSLERALASLYTTNLHLDQLVAERTHAHSEALAYVQNESSKTAAILQGIVDGVVVFDRNGTAIMNNPAAGHLLGWPRDQIVGNNINALMKDHVSSQDQATIHEMLMEDAPPAPAVTVDWHRKTLSISFAFVRDAHQEFLGTVAVFRDFTHEAEIDRMKSAFVSIASHELRTPLNAILGYTDMLHENVYGVLTEEQRNITNYVMANSRRMLSLINSLLDQAQMEAGRLSLRYTTFSPIEFLKKTEQVATILAANRPFELHFQIADNLPEALTSDPHRLEQIILTLTEVVGKFSANGKVWITVDYKEGLILRIISIISPHVQLIGALHGSDEIHAVGLQVVRNLIEAMNGTLSVNENKAATTITVALPIDNESAS